MASPVALHRLLARIDQTLLSSAADARLQTSQYERNRVGTNIEHARAMLLTLEKESATVSVQSQRQQLQADLQQKRDWIKKLNARLRELQDASQETSGEAISDEEGESDGDANEEGVEQNTLNSYAPARQDVEGGLESGRPQDTTSSLSQPLQREETQTQTQGVRSRTPNLKASDNRSAASTTAREQLFGGRPKAQDPSLQQTESLMSHNRSEQETLTNGLLGLAQALKESSLNFGASLEAEKDTLSRAEGTLDKSAQGMQAAEKKMSMLRRMSEGQGWWGRIKLYAFIAGLWLACFLLVFVGPKLRF